MYTTIQKKESLHTNPQRSQNLRKENRGLKLSERGNHQNLLQFRSLKPSPKSTQVIQMFHPFKKLLLGVGVPILAHQGFTYWNKNYMQNNDSLKGFDFDDDQEDPIIGHLQIRKYQAFKKFDSNPFWHVWLSFKSNEGNVVKVAERGNGSEDWENYSPIEEIEISASQLKKLMMKNQDLNQKYWPTLYGPGWNDCHTWIQMVQNYAGIQKPLSTPRFKVKKEELD